MRNENELIRARAIDQGASNDNAYEAYAGRAVAGQLADLAAMRALGMAMATGLTDYATGKVTADEAPVFAKENDAILAFARVSRAVRQIIVLEQEILGLRDVPEEQSRSTRDRMESARRTALWRAWPVDDPSDLRDAREPDDLNDYDDGPVDDVIAHVSATLTSIGASIAETIRPRDADGRFARVLPSSLSSSDLIRGSTSSVSEVSADARNEYGHDELKDEPEDDHRHGRDPP